MYLILFVVLALSHPVGPGGVGQGLLLEYPSMRNDNCAPRLQGRQLNANRVMNGGQIINYSYCSRV